eukprot:Nk52_evm35s2630 gene=Nk52_evmTU35s2630
MIYRDQFTINTLMYGKYYDGIQNNAFTFDGHGTYSITLTATEIPGQTYFVICSDLNDCKTKYNTQFCPSAAVTSNSHVIPEIGSFYRSALLTTDTPYANVQISTTITLTSLLVVCSNVTEKSYPCESKVETQNPGGEQLSKEEIPIPIVYEAFLVLWGVILIYAIFNWGRFREASNKLHKLVFGIAVAMSVSFAYSFMTWYLLSREGELNVFIVQFYYIVGNAAIAYQFFVYLVVASGWGVLKNSLHVYSWHMTTCLVVLFYLSLNLVSWISVYFFVLTVICIGLMWYYVLKTVGYQLLLLRAVYDRLGMIERRFERTDNNFVSLQAPIVRKFQLFRAYRMLFITYTLAYLIIFFSQNMLAASRSVILDVTVRLLVISVGSIGLMWLFKLKDFSKYSNIVLDRKMFDIPAEERLGYDPENIVFVSLPGDSCTRHMGVIPNGRGKISSAGVEGLPNSEGEEGNGRGNQTTASSSQAEIREENRTATIIEMDTLGYSQRGRNVFT